VISAYTDFIPWIQLRVPTCPPLLIQQAVQASVRRLCMESENYIIEQAPYNLTADEFVYTITPPPFYDIVRIFDVRIKTDTTNQDPTSKGPTVDPTGYRYQMPDILEFGSEPVDANYANSMYIRWVVAPREDYTVFDWYYVTRWVDVIRDGALAYLYLLPGRPWTSTELYVEHEGKFIKGMSQGRRESYTSGTSRQISIALGSFT